MNKQIHLVGKNRVDSHEIIYLKADANYTEIYFVNGKKLVISKTLKQLEKQFEAHDFFRTHKSFLINMVHVKSIRINDGVKVQLANNIEADISRRKKDAFITAMRAKN